MRLTVSAQKKTIAQARELAPVLGYLVRPMSLTAYVLALWRVAADMRWAQEFFISNGLFSRWQVWLAIAIATQILGQQVSRDTHPDDNLAQ